MPEIGNRAPVLYGLFLVGQDMRYDTEKAGETLRIQCAEGVYDVTWDIYGHPEKAVRVNG